jgi:hypothetical protein
MPHPVRLHIRARSFDPAQAELWLSVHVSEPASGLEVRGRLVGPRCPYATTVEIAYPLRPLPEPLRAGTTFTHRVVIPEASLWDPQSPFLYHGVIELWQDGTCHDRIPLQHGLRQLTIDRRGLCCNGRPIRLRGREAMPASDAELQRLRQDGVNLLVAPLEAEADDLWERAERLGMLMLGRVDAEEDLSRITSRASCLGWLLPASASFVSPGGLRGLELDEPPRASVPAGVSFLVCPPRLLQAVLPLGLPVLLRGSAAELAGFTVQPQACVLGEVQSPLDNRRT